MRDRVKISVDSVLLERFGYQTFAKQMCYYCLRLFMGLYVMLFESLWFQLLEVLEALPKLLNTTMARERHAAVLPTLPEVCVIHLVCSLLDVCGVHIRLTSKPGVGVGVFRHLTA